jgi:hypothetical protein
MKTTAILKEKGQPLTDHGFPDTTLDVRFFSTSPDAFLMALTYEDRSVEIDITGMVEDLERLIERFKENRLARVKDTMQQMQAKQNQPAFMAYRQPLPGPAGMRLPASPASPEPAPPMKLPPLSSPQIRVHLTKENRSAVLWVLAVFEHEPEPMCDCGSPFITHHRNSCPVAERSRIRDAESLGSAMSGLPVEKQTFAVVSMEKQPSDSWWIFHRRLLPTGEFELLPIESEELYEELVHVVDDAFNDDEREP